ncbi:DUF2971 domain-containing protein [Salinibacterium sp. NG253]|uniref:DUF2971 domain-containing protein n=1 Tax=Salinibacterium sp. NG253 TaxID=2792039 RepID=UPI0018CD9F96|nr:DUF2971 domain-containing protein [Salinibacterium sp. NG253]MBH0115255.1 DUF2971 domain-containing protein [Salinibacterium sp. NG253]
MTSSSNDAFASVGGFQPYIKIGGNWIEYPDHNWHAGAAWHYTSVAGCYGILANHELWASSASMMNDPEEINYGVQKVAEVYVSWRLKNPSDTPAHEFLQSAIDGLGRSMKRAFPFILSASTSPHLLNQWANYGDGSGCCIGLDGKTMLHVVGRDGPADKGEHLPAWLTVIYDYSAQEAHITRLFDQLVESQGQIASALQADQFAQELLFQNLAMLVASLKHPAYAAEKEVRFVVTRKPDDTLAFRPSQRGIVPYQRLGGTINLSNGKIGLPDDPSKPLRLPIQAIYVGPPQGESEIRRIRSMSDFAAAQGYEVDVLGAGIPYLP